MISSFIRARLWNFLGGRLFPICLTMAWILTGCLGPMPRRGGSSEIPPTLAPDSAPNPHPISAPMTLPVPAPADGSLGLGSPEMTVVSTATVGAEILSSFAPGPRVVLVWAPEPNTPPLPTARWLQQHPHVRLTALFPDRFFGDDEDSRQAKSIFQTLVSSRQVEVVLTLPDRPVLPLLIDTQEAASSSMVKALPTRFAWAEDAMDQLIYARESYRRRWRCPPVGVDLPWGMVGGSELPLLEKTKLSWALVASTPGAPTVGDVQGMTLIRPGLWPSGTTARDGYFSSWVSPVLASSGTVGPIRFSSVEHLEEFIARSGSVASFWVSEWLAKMPPSDKRLWSLESVDFSPWIGDYEENQAWELLGVVREAVAEYQNGGNASLTALDLAKRAIHKAESGAYFDTFGAEKEGARNADVWRDFLATLSQVYPIIGKPVPAEIKSGIVSPASGGAVTKEAEGSFERVGTLLRWNDAANDDRGPGDYFYPTGAQFPAGAWDLRRVEVIPDTATIKLVFEFPALDNPGRAPLGFSLPLVDIYIDINRSAGAGAQELLAGRPGITEAEDAWEYAISFDGWSGRFYQSVPGQPPRAVGSVSVGKSSPTEITVEFSRRWCRGDPGSWGYAVLVMGRSAAGSFPTPVALDPGPDCFGGGFPNRSAPPYIDILVPSGQTQRRVLGVYRGGQEVTIPFVRPTE